MTASGRTETLTCDAARPTAPERLDPTRCSHSAQLEADDHPLQRIVRFDLHSLSNELHAAYQLGSTCLDVAAQRRIRDSLKYLPKIL